MSIGWLTRRRRWDEGSWYHDYGRLWRKYRSRSSSSKLSNFSALCLFNGLRPWVAFRALRIHECQRPLIAAGLNMPFVPNTKSHFRSPHSSTSPSPIIGVTFERSTSKHCHCSIHPFYCVHLEKNTSRRCVELSEVNESSAAQSKHDVCLFVDNCYWQILLDITVYTSSLQSGLVWISSVRLPAATQWWTH